MGAQARDLVLVAAAIAAAPLLADYISHWVRIPLVVFEISLGMLLGPAVTGWVKPDQALRFLGTLGLAMLFLLAGYELDFERVRGRPLRLAGLGWVCSLAVATVCGISLSPTVTAGIIVGICLTTTAMGTIVPVLRDAGELSTRFGSAVLAIGAVGEFGSVCRHRTSDHRGGDHDRGQRSRDSPLHRRRAGRSGDALRAHASAARTDHQAEAARCRAPCLGRPTRATHASPRCACRASHVPH